MKSSYLQLAVGTINAEVGFLQDLEEALFEGNIRGVRDVFIEQLFIFGLLCFVVDFELPE